MEGGKRVEAVKKRKREGVKGRTELCDLPWGKQQAHTAESCGPQTPYQKPKQLSIIQQVQSEPATEEKTWEARRFEGREEGWRRYSLGVRHKGFKFFILCQCVQKYTMWCTRIDNAAVIFCTFWLIHQQQWTNAGSHLVGNCEKVYGFSLKNCLFLNFW